MFADQLLASLLALPPRKWGDLLGTADALGQGHLLLAWFRDAADQENVVRSSFGGAVRQDPGDYLYPVDSNVAPATKLNAWTARSLDLSVQIDAVGNARNTMAVTWENQVDTPDGAPYRAMTNVGGRILGMYFRLLVPERSRIEAVSGGGLAPVTDPAVVEDEAGRMAIGDLPQDPAWAAASLRYTWTSPYTANVDASGGEYRLTIQKQPGALPGALTLTVRVPGGYRITAASPALTVNGRDGDDDGDLRSGHRDRRDIRTLTPDSRVRDAVLHSCFQCSLAELEIRHVRTQMARVRKAFRPVPVRHMGRPRRRRAFPVPHRSRSRTRRSSIRVAIPAVELQVVENHGHGTGSTPTRCPLDGGDHVGSSGAEAGICVNVMRSC